MSFDDNERSAQQNRPIDLYTITTPTATYTHTSHPVDVPYAGQIYTALTVSRGNLQIGQDPSGRELFIYLPITHPLVQRFAATGIPEHGVLVTIRRLQVVSGVAIQYRSGYAGGMSITGGVAQVRVPDLTDDATKIQLPVIAAHPTCNHILFDTQCSFDDHLGLPDPPVAASFLITTTIAAPPSGTAITVSSVGGKPDDWFTFGDAVHVATQQRRMIVSQTGTSLVLIAAFVGAGTGDVIQIYAGCDHGIGTCVTKFNNRKNFGGHPKMNAGHDLWNPNGQGIIQQY